MLDGRRPPLGVCVARGVRVGKVAAAGIAAMSPGHMGVARPCTRARNRGKVEVERSTAPSLRAQHSTAHVGLVLNGSSPSRTGRAPGWEHHPESGTIEA